MIDYYKCGNYVYQKKGLKNWVCYRCTKFSNNHAVIVEFFKQYPIRGVKAKDFVDWVKAAEILKNGGHLTKEGAAIIQDLKAGVNTKRII